MSTTTNSRTQMVKRRSLVSTAGAILGLVLALAWFVAVRQQSRSEKAAANADSLERAEGLIALLRQAAQDRVKGAAQLLAEDPRLKSTLSVADVDDATILDVLQDVQKLNGLPMYAVLSSAGRVKVVLGATKLKGLDLSTSAVVKAAMSQEGAATGVWLVDDRVIEVAAVAVRIGDRVVALLVLGSQVGDVALAKAAEGSGVHLALTIDDRLAWADSTSASSTWSGDVRRIEVKDAVPPAKFIAVPKDMDEATWRLAYLVPLFALLFAVLAFWRGGAR